MMVSKFGISISRGQTCRFHVKFQGSIILIPQVCFFLGHCPVFCGVSEAGGLNVALQDELDANEKLFVGGQHLRYTGTLKFYSPRLQRKEDFLLEVFV